MSESPADAGWVVGGIGAAIGTLATAVATLFKLNENKNAQAIVELKERLLVETSSLKSEIELSNKRFAESDKKHDECQHDRENLRVEMARLSMRIEMNTERDTK